MLGHGVGHLRGDDGLHDILVAVQFAALGPAGQLVAHQQHEGLVAVQQNVFSLGVAQRDADTIRIGIGGQHQIGAQPRTQLDGLGHGVIGGPESSLAGESAAGRSRSGIALAQHEVRGAVLGIQVTGLTRSGGSARNVVGHEAHQRDAHKQFLTLGGVFLDIQCLVQVGLRLCIVLLVLESLGQEHGRLRRRLHLIVFLGDREVEITVALGARHQSHGLRKQRLVVGSGGQYFTLRTADEAVSPELYAVGLSRGIGFMSHTVDSYNR